MKGIVPPLHPKRVLTRGYAQVPRAWTIGAGPLLSLVLEENELLATPLYL